MKTTNTELSQQFSEGKFASCYDYFTNDIRWKVICNKTLEGKEDVMKFCEDMLK